MLKTVGGQESLEGLPSLEGRESLEGPSPPVLRGAGVPGRPPAPRGTGIPGGTPILSTTKIQLCILIGWNGST